MHRIDHVTAEPDTHGAGKDGFTEGDPVGGVPPTTVTGDIMNSFQEEICNVIEAAGMALDKGDLTQLLQAIQFFLPHKVYNPTSFAAPAVVGDSEVALTEAYVIPADSLKVGTNLRARIRVRVENAGVLATLRVRIGSKAGVTGYIVAACAFTAVDVDPTGYYAHFDMDMLVTAIGANGRIRSSALIHINQQDDVEQHSRSFSAAGGTDVDTTGALDLFVTGEYASGTDDVSIEQFTVTRQHGATAP